MFRVNLRRKMAVGFKVSISLQAILGSNALRDVALLSTDALRDVSRHYPQFYDRLSGINRPVGPVLPEAASTSRHCAGKPNIEPAYSSCRGA
jgi:hypothetical protein